ncbi:MAG: 3-oxoacyl-[acyl-carrier-protein] reductase [Planctomycetota bacterium]|nr:3-oxoacyl-[acyl-carrier-protein] reductase [Planctomycetota bacterium]
MTPPAEATDSRVAIVTGASRGIGRSIATRLASDGHHVVLVARSAGPLEELAAEIKAAGGSACAVPCDLSDGDAVTAMVEGVASDHGRLDVLVNNAGITRDGLMLRMSDEDFDEVLNVNLRSIFIACRAAARPMMRGRFGRMINISSVTGLIGNPGQANYAAAKAGIIGMTKTIAKEFASKGVTANVVAPGFIETEMTEALGSAVLEEAAKRIPLKRLGQGDDIAHAVSYLASEGAGYVTGQVLTVDGGMVC